jgi:hypothetical protein
MRQPSKEEVELYTNALRVKKLTPAQVDTMVAVCSRHALVSIAYSDDASTSTIIKYMYDTYLGFNLNDFSTLALLCRALGNSEHHIVSPLELLMTVTAFLSEIPIEVKEGQAPEESKGSNPVTIYWLIRRINPAFEDKGDWMYYACHLKDVKESPWMRWSSFHIFNDDRVPMYGSRDSARAKARSLMDREPQYAYDIVEVSFDGSTWTLLPNAERVQPWEANVKDR